MNMNFKLGKVSIPVSEEVKVDVEGMEISVTDYDLKEGLMVAKAIPGILRELKAVFEEESAPSADEEDGQEIGYMNHPVFGKCKVVKVKHGEHPLQGIADEINEHLKNIKPKPSLGEMLKNIGNLPPQGKSPLEGLFGGVMDLGNHLDKEI